MELPLIERSRFRLRPWHQDDAAPLVRYANNPKIARNLRDDFPSPYTLRDARKWLEPGPVNRKNIILAVEVEGEAAGGIGLHGLSDVHRYNAELGYWLAEDHWGKGIMTEAIGAMVDYAFLHTHWLRIFATVFQHNKASMRVLEKNGFHLEAIHKRNVMKEGRLLDEYLFAIRKEEWI